MKHQNGTVAVLLFILIIACSAVFGRTLELYADAVWRSQTLWVLAAIMLVYLLYELRNLVYFIRANSAGRVRSDTKAVSALVLMNDEISGIQYWDLRGKTGIIIGRSRGNEYVDVDLSDTEYAAAISACHAIMNYTAEGWKLADAGSRNGTAVMRNGVKLSIAPNEPIPVSSGDTIYIAEETALAVE